VRKDGEVRELAYAIVLNVLPGFHCAFMHDITARKEAERAVQRLSAHLLQLQDEERRRIARQLHDTTAQNLAAIRLNLAIVRRSVDTANLKVLQSLDESLALTDESIGEVRTLAYLLHPPMIEEAGLLVTLRWFAQGFEARSGIRVTLDFPEVLSRLPLEMETAIFRIVQEGLNNIQRHSGSTVANIRIERPPDVLRLQIEDEGQGLPLHLRGDDVVTAAAGVGIASIRERVRELGGTMTVQSSDDGTVLSVTLPLSED
jgi:signal transduction histidine kinase